MEIKEIKNGPQVKVRLMHDNITTTRKKTEHSKSGERNGMKQLRDKLFFIVVAAAGAG